MARRHNQRNKGIHRDPDTGVVLARENRHPLAWVFESVPVHSIDHPEATLPTLNMDPEMCHLLAIHVFDNLRVPAPVESDALYRLVKSAATEYLPNQWKQQMWLPWSIGDEFVEPRPVDATEPADLMNIPVEDMTDAQLDAHEALISEQRLIRKQAAQLDNPIEPDEPEFVRYNREAMDRIERQIRADGEGSPEQ